MWIVRVALDRPYTFIVLALMIVILSGVAITRTPTDIFQELNDLPIKVSGTATIYLRDVATVSDAYAPQTNIVRKDGRRGVLISVLKAGTASTIDVVSGIRATLKRAVQTLPPELKIEPLADQSVFVKAAISGVIREAVIAAGLTAVMIFLFLGSWLRDAILSGASQIAVPALVSTLCICIVFVPMFLLGGVARYLFLPLAEAVVFAMLASYILSRTLVPTMAMYLLRAKHGHSETPSRNSR